MSDPFGNHIVGFPTMRLINYVCTERVADPLTDLSCKHPVRKNAKMMYKIAYNIAPSYLINLFQMRNVSDDTISICVQWLIKTSWCQNLFKNSLTYSGAIIWNSIPLEIKNSSSLNIFVNKCKAWMKRGE